MSDTPDLPPSSLRADPEAIARLLQDGEGHDPSRLPPVHLWHPPFCGDIDMEIRRNGQWFYQGGPINRLPLVKLFSNVLRREEDGHYYLVTPVEKVRICVEDAPFVAVTVERHVEAGIPYLRFTLQTGDVVVADADHPLRIEWRTGDEPHPYLRVRDRLEALISRNVYYQLVEWGEEQVVDGRPALVVTSAGERFLLGWL
ncbi:MAG: DUF1285 domain-containing protein [Moraxellaceae bacterium]